MALAEAFLHLSKVAASPDLGMLILNFVFAAVYLKFFRVERAR